jgi:hypothetical protein
MFIVARKTQIVGLIAEQTPVDQGRMVLSLTAIGVSAWSY